MKKKMIETSLFDLSGKVAIVTGSSKGIGKAIAQSLADHGAKVVISSRKPDACEAVADEINAACAGKAGEAVSIPANIGHKDDLEALVAAADAEPGEDEDASYDGDDGVGD